MDVSTSGVVGFAGRYELPTTLGPRAADLRLAGAPLPLTGTVRIYTCGITPYDVTHLGHAATFVWADLLGSLARALDVRTVTSRNVTDVDDVLTAAAGRHHRHYDELAVTQEFLFDRDMRDLGVSRPDVTPHARAHVPQVVQLTDALLRLGRAYESDGTVFFRAPHDLDRNGLSESEALAAFAEFGDREQDGREAAWDVPLWKPSPDDHPAWPSPWGWGRPAWHVECTAMAATVFGASVDVLVGGADLAFPHHAYQAAISEAATGIAPFARSQMHVGTVCFAGAKMAKSTGNLVLVRDLLGQVPGPVLRLLLLNRPWGDSWEYAPELLDDAGATLERLHAAAGRPASAGRDQVLGALLDDLDVPHAVAMAEECGGAAARLLLGVLRLST
jgi:cysteinyl-tRNA synthetase